MKQKVMTKGLSGKTVFRLLFTGFFVTLMPLAILAGIDAISGKHTVFSEGKPVTGVAGFFEALIAWPIMALGFSAFVWLPCMIGQWVHRKFRPIPIEYTLVESEDSKTAST